MNEFLLRAFLHHLDPERQITILRSSQDEGLYEYMTAVGYAGICDMDPDGNIYVQINDVDGVTKAVWLEELAHARQCIISGSPQASSDMKDIATREIEVHECLLANASRLRLTPQEIENCKAQLQYYKEITNG